MLEFLNTYFLGACLPPLLVAAGLFFTVKLRAFPLLHPIMTVRRMREGERQGGGSFRALTVALAGTLGVGNIAGVAVALVAGGAGAVFWMWVGGFAAMLLKYAEIALTLDARRGESRGAVDYIEPTLGKAAARVFAILCLLCSLTMGSLLQGNVMAEALTEEFGVSPLASALILLALTGMLFCGGKELVERASVVLIPFFTLLYTGLAIYIIFVNFTLLPSVLLRILQGAFSLQSAGGGLAGFACARAIRAGIGKGLFSNEAGAGTAPIAHGGVGAVPPAKQGLFGIVEVFVDTILVCTVTAFVILLAFDPIPTLSGSGLAAAAFATEYGGAAGAIIRLSIVFFAYATVACWSYYGRVCMGILTKKEGLRQAYPLLFLLSLAAGVFFSPRGAWALTDAILGIMTILNVTALLLRQRRVCELTADFGLIGKAGHARTGAHRGERPREGD